MKLKIVSKRDEIPNLDPKEKFIHLGFRASNVDILKLIHRCPGLRMIQIPHTYCKTMSNMSKIFFKERDIITLEGDVWGYRKNLKDDFIIDDTIIEEIRILAKSGANVEDITGQLKEKIRISPDLIKYIIEN
jgi:hypothetical protein